MKIDDTAARLDQALKAASIEIFGVSLGDINNKETWRVDYKPGATTAMEKKAEEIIKDFEI